MEATLFKREAGPELPEMACEMFMALVVAKQKKNPGMTQEAAWARVKETASRMSSTLPGGMSGCPFGPAS